MKRRSRVSIECMPLDVLCHVVCIFFIDKNPLVSCIHIATLQKVNKLFDMAIRRVIHLLPRPSQCIQSQHNLLHFKNIVCEHLRTRSIFHMLHRINNPHYLIKYLPLVFLSGMTLTETVNSRTRLKNIDHDEYMSRHAQAYRTIRTEYMRIRDSLPPANNPSGWIVQIVEYVTNE